MTALVTKHLPFVAAASNGISTLRELILELAIQGRLLKRERTAPSWQMLKLPEVATYRIGKTPPSKEARHWDDAGIPWVSISDMEHFSVLAETSRSVSKDMASETFKYPPIPAGSLLMSFKLTVGKICVLGVDAYHNEAIISLRPNEGVLRDYLMRVLPSIARSGKTKDALMGATLNSASLAELIIPLPTLEEQHRIVAKVDELMALCDRLEADQADAEAAHAQLVQALLDSLTQATDAADFRASWQRLSEHFHTLFTTEASIEALKQTVLRLAVMGKVVKQDLSFKEDGPCALEKIIAWRKQAVISREIREPRNAVKSIGVDEHPYRLPDGWAWVRLGTLIYIQSGDGLTAANMRAGAIPVFGGNGINGYHDGCNVFSRTLVIGRVGYYCGSIHVTPENAWVTDNAFITKFCAEAVDIRFLYWLLKITNLKENDSATAQPVISGAKIYPIVVGLPPLGEQHCIVAKVDELMALCDQLKAQLAEGRQQHAQLASVLVEQAVA